MRRWFHCAAAVLLGTSALATAAAPLSPTYARPAAATAKPGKALLPLRVTMQPDLTKVGIKIGRDVPVRITVTDGKGKPVNAALINITVPNSPRPILGTAPHGVLT